jgi:hypothetical protein
MLLNRKEQEMVPDNDKATKIFRALSTFEKPAYLQLAEQNLRTIVVKNEEFRNIERHASIACVAKNRSQPDDELKKATAALKDMEPKIVEARKALNEARRKAAPAYKAYLIPHLEAALELYCEAAATMETITEGLAAANRICELNQLPQPRLIAAAFHLGGYLRSIKRTLMNQP